MSGQTPLERTVADINSGVFFREFSFSRTSFRPTPARQLEFADHTIWIDDLLIVFQLKERTKPTGELAVEERWLREKVFKQATRQIRDTLGYLDEFDTITIRNERGHERVVTSRNASVRINVVLFSNSEMSASDRARVPKNHQSATAGFIHVMEIRDYLLVCQKLVTPIELVSYLGFRELLLQKHCELCLGLAEEALLGQFLAGAIDDCPAPSWTSKARSLDEEIESFDISAILSKLPSKIESSIGSDEPDSYYCFIRECARLNRFELREVRKRFSFAIDWCRRPNSGPPMRFAAARTGCGFMWTAVPPHLLSRRHKGLLNLTEAAKYSLGVDRCIGISVAADGRDTLIDWMYIDHPWEKDYELEEFLEKCDPFPPVQIANLGSYNFK